MNIAIVFGAKSFEHEISIVSSIAMKKVLKHKLTYIFIDNNREFYLIPTDTIKSSLFSSGEYKKCDKLNLKQSGFYKSSLFGDKKVDMDIVLNLTHGGDGEDGILASMFEFFNILFIGPRTVACVASFDKSITKSYARDCDVKALDFIYHDKDKELNIENFPVIVKPCKLGSSIGISIVHSKEELDYALDVAFEFDDSVIIEPFINGVKEYNLAGAKVDGEFVFSIVEEPKKEEFLDFDKKYLDFNRTSRVSEADISDELKGKLQDNFKKIYNNTFDGALIRCDFFVIDDEVFINEINPIPGSMSNYLFEDFNSVIEGISRSLPKRRDISINYDYVNKIQSAKGKA
jgi:D-alanine-D-alanine ligase